LSAASLPLIAVSILAVVGMLVRPFRSPEWIWACGGALLLLLLRVISPSAAVAAVGRGADIYAFLVGIMALSGLASLGGLFDWLASAALHLARGSQQRLLLLVYVGGALVTALFSNDTTAVVLTPAVLATIKRTRANPLPYLFACAFVANAASFVLPISNPANLVVFGLALPALLPWVHAFGLSAVAALGITFLVLRLVTRRSLQEAFVHQGWESTLSPWSTLCAVVIAGSALALLGAAAFHIDVGYTALCAAAASLGIVSWRERSVARNVTRAISWQIVPLVAGLFVIVAALDHGGAIQTMQRMLLAVSHVGTLERNLLVGTAVAVAVCLLNNLPVALAAGFALAPMHLPATLTHATVVAVDLGPNLCITGSLASILWLIILRDHGITVTPWQFMRIGALILVPSLAVALVLVR
jgi:arsenical pump membrane protein